MPKKILFASQDNHALYEEVDNPDRFTKIELDETIVLKTSDLCGHDGDILEILIAARKAKVICPALEA